MDLPNIKKPCRECPFRKDCLKGWLGENRITEILKSDSFVCHKNVQFKCAGFMILKNNENSFFRLAERLKIKIYLRGHELVFNTKKQCINHHKK